MAVAQGPFLAAVLLLISRLHCSSPLPACPESCACQSTPLLNCSSAGLSFVPQQIQDSVTDLDLSHNLLDSVTLYRPHRSLRNVWLGNNSITRLSLCVERSIRGRHVHRLRPQSRRGCVSWAPTLQLLSVERNQLEQLPQGLEGSESLQVLQLSFNRISTLRPGDLSHLRQLKELHLQHNLITSLHPQMFQDLARLQVLDLSFNMLTSLHPLTYFSLRHIGADVQLGGNSWQCDCSMRSLRRRMAYDSSRGLQAWSMACATPSIISGRDLLQVEEHDLNCFSAEDGPEVHRDVTVYSGSEILLSCSTQDSTWWTPSGQASVSQPQAGLLISDVTERDAGLYVCVSEEREVVSVFNLQISKIGGARRKARSLPRTSQETIPQDTPDRIGQERNPRASQSDLALAVCLSVFITFLIAFILGVLARPCIDVLWGRITKKKSTSATHSVSSVEQRQYDNEAYCDGEEPGQIGAHRERRVTFSTVDYREDRNVQYYDTVAGDNQETINSEAVIECEARNANTARDSGSENSVRLSITEDNQRDGTVLSGGHTHSIEFEHIPDPVEQEKRRSLSSCSDSSQSDKVLNEDQMTQKTTTKSHQLAEDSSTDIRVQVSQISVEGTSKLPGFSSEPFADWSPHTNNTSFTDPELWQENGEQFEFSDSVHSSSVRSSSVRGSFNDSKLILVPTSDRQRTDDSSSSSSYVSENEPTQYTVNSDQEEEDKERNHNNPEVNNASLQQGVSFEQQIHSVDSIRPTVRFNQDDYRPAVRPEDSFSSHSSDSDVKDYTFKTGHVPTLAVTSHSKSLDTGAPSPSAAYPSSSSSESEAEIKDLKVEHGTGRLNEGIKINKVETLSTDRDCISIPQIKMHVDIKTPLPASDSSSSDESTDETTKHTKKQEQGELNTAGQSVTHDAMKPQCPALDPAPATAIKRRAPLPPIDSSGEESANKTMEQKQKQGETQMMRLPIKVSQTASRDSHIRWPALDLEDTTRVKRRLDIKAPSPPPDSSSSSESEDETTKHIKRQEQKQMNTARPPSKVSETARYNPQTQWPLLDLQHTKHIKRRLDIKAPSPDSDSSSSSDSGDETTHHTEMPGKVEIAGLPLQESQTGSHAPSTVFPSIDLEHIPHIKRRLDIKAPSPPPDSSSSGDSEEETTHHIQRPGNVEITGLPFQESQTESHDPDTRWPALDLEHIPRVKRRLDIKAPSPDSDSSSSSDSEEETINHINKQEQGQMNMSRLPSKVPETARYNPQTQWPLLDLQHTKHIKRRLDIKAPSPDSDSSSSSDSEDETSGHNKKQRPAGVDIAVPSFEKSQTGSHDPGTVFPSIDLEHIPRIKRRLDIKAPSPPLEPPSSCEIVEKHEQRKVHISRHPSQGPQAESRDPDTSWPVVDLEHTMRVKRRLDIKAPPPSSGSSLSSDTEDETTHKAKKEEQAETHMARPPITVSQTVSYDPRTQWPLLDLEHTKHVKRRLDVKAPSPYTDSSSSSDSEDETTRHTERPGKVTFAELPLQKSQTINQDPESQWPALDLGPNLRIKRRLDIKSPSPVSDSSSSSHSEDETTHSTKTARPAVVGVVGPPFQESQTVSRDPETQWPTVDLGNITRIKRRLDIKAPSPPPDSLLIGGSTNHTMEGKREEAIKISPGHSSGSSDEQEKSLESLRYPPPTVKPDSRWPTLDLNSDLHVKRRLDIRARSPPSESSSSSDESESGTTNPPKTDMGITSHRPEGKMLDFKVNVPPVKRRLNITAPSAQPDPVLSSVSPSSRQSESYSSRSNSEDERRGQAKAGLGVSAPLKTTEKEFITAPKTPLINISHPPRADHNIKLEKYTVVTDDVGVKTSDNISRPPEINPELQSRWAAMDLGISRFRKRLEITSQTREPPNLPSSPPPDSPSSSSSDSGTGSRSSKTRQGVGIQGIVHTESSLTTINKVQRKAGTELRSQTSEESHSVHPHLSLTNIPHVKRTLDIRAPLQRESSSSSSSEDETIAHSVPDLSLGVPRVKRRLDIKAPSPEPSNSSSSESENYVTQNTVNQSRHPSNTSGMIDNDHLITYKRLIMKPSSPLGNSFTPSGMDQTIDHTKQRYTGPEIVTVTRGGPLHSVGDRDASLSPKRVPSMSFDDVVKKRLEQSRSTTDLDVPPEIRWTGVGRQLSDRSLPGPRTHLDVGVSSSQQAPPAKPECPPPDSSSSDSDDNIKQDKGKADVTLMHKHSSLSASGVSLAPSRALDKFDSPPSSTSELLRALSEDTNKRKGLSALKAMSTERQKWDTVDGNLDKGASFTFDDTSFKPLAKQPLPQSRLSSTSVDERRAKDLLYDIPRYRRHDMGDTEPPQRAPPPVPATPPPPYEAVGLSQRFPQSSTAQGLQSTRSYLQQSRKTEESTSSSVTSQNLAVYFDSSNVNISEV